MADDIAARDRVPVLDQMDQPHDPLVDAGPVVEDIEERGVGICKIAVDVGWRDKVASFVGEQRLPLLKLPAVEQVGFVKEEALDAMLEQHGVDGGIAAHASCSEMRRSHSFQKQRIWSSSS